MKNTNLKKLSGNIESTISAYNKSVYSYSELSGMLRENKSGWGLPESLTAKAFISLLTDIVDFREIQIELPYRNETRYVFGDLSVYELAVSLKPRAYLTHFTAMHLHGLTDQIPKTVYLNYEQSPKRKPKGNLRQDLVDRAFKRDIKRTKNKAKCEGFTIHVINGMHTGRRGVIKTVGAKGEILNTTNVERTLIDITVRPEYSGGPYEVIKAYRLAYDKVSVNALAAMLKKLDYVYPFHQAIGYYLQRAGVYRDSQIALLRKFEMHYDFYLAHNMTETDYSSEWRLYFPKDF